MIEKFPAFHIGRTVITANALAKLLPTDVEHALARHAAGDWGDVDEHDRDLNDRGLLEGCRLLSVYQASNGVKFWVITEWDRSVTTVLLPDDY